jgi:hypothetical protein
VVRLRYKGRVPAISPRSSKRVASMATRMGIKQRILDIDSSGGQVEDAIRAGDVMADTSWTMWVREGAVCHSACVLLLAAGDDRVISGAVGVHRIIRIQSEATSRAQTQCRTARSARCDEGLPGAQRRRVAVADFMMTVPNRACASSRPTSCRPSA